MHLLAGGVAGGLAAAFTTPLDCVKTVLNTQQTPQVILTTNPLCNNKSIIKKPTSYIGNLFF